MEKSKLQSSIKRYQYLQDQNNLYSSNPVIESQLLTLKLFINSLRNFGVVASVQRGKYLYCLQIMFRINKNYCMVQYCMTYSQQNKLIIIFLLLKTLQLQRNMIRRTPRTQLVQIFGQSGTCDVIDFGKNVEMSTDIHYTFLDRQKFEYKMGKEMKEFHLKMNQFCNYSNKIKDQTEIGKINFKFEKRSSYAGFYNHQDNLNESAPILDSSIVNYKAQKKKTLFDIDLKFDFQKINLNLNKNVRKSEQIKQIKSQMTLRQIVKMGEIEYFRCNKQQYESYQDIFSDLFNQQQKLHDVQPSKDVKILTEYISKETSLGFKNIDPSKGFLTTIEGEEFNFQIIKDFRPYKILGDNVLMPSEIDRQETIITKQHLLAYSGKGYSLNEFKKHLQIQKKKKKQQKLFERENSLQTQMQEIQMKIKMMKYKLKQKKKIQHEYKETQTQKIISDIDLKDTIFSNDQILISKIDNVLRIKTIQLQKNKNPQKVYRQIHPVINSLCFDLLIIIVTGEKFINWGSFMRSDNKELLQKDVLQLIYQNMGYLDLKPFQSGNTKIRLLKLYLDLKMMIQAQGNQIFKQSKIPTVRKINRYCHMNQHQRMNYENGTPKYGLTSSLSNSQSKNSTSRSLSFHRRTNVQNKKSRHQIKQIANTSKKLNQTTKQNTTNFNRTKNNTTAENIQKRINNMFGEDSASKTVLSKKRLLDLPKNNKGLKFYKNNLKNTSSSFTIKT